MLALAAAIGLALVGIAVLVRVGLLGGLEMRLAYITLYPAVTAACVIGGFFAGVFATIFSAVIASFWLAPLREAVDYLGLATFLLSCGLIIGVTEAMHRARAHALDAEARAKVSDALRESEAALKESEAQARRQQALFQGVFDSTPEAMFVTGMDRRIILINPAFRRLFGYELADLAGSGPEAIYSESEDWKRISRLLSAADEGAFGQPQAARFKPKDGDAFPGEILIGPYRDAARRPLGYVGMVRDLTMELQQDDAKRQSQKLEALGQLTGGIAHDFNNILTTIIGNHEFLESKIRGSDEWDALRRANNAAQMAARLTSRLLTFARRRRLEPVVVNLNELVATITDLLRRTLGETVALDLNLAAKLDSVRADVSEVENTIINLALNARDAMPDGGRLTIETRNLALQDGNVFGLAAGSYVGVFVTDTGTGMAPEIAERAFEPFFSTKGPGRGTGLGLSTVYGFAEQSGGAVRIESVLGRGTAVKVLLPRVDAESSRGAESQQIAFSKFAETVLVVEDDPDVRETTMRRVEGLGYVAIDAANGPAAIRVLESDAGIDLVFSDVAMPGGMSGYDLARWIRAHRPGIKVLLTSGHVDPSRSGAPLPDIEFDLLDKPYSRAELAQALARALKYES